MTKLNLNYISRKEFESVHKVEVGRRKVEVGRQDDLRKIERYYGKQLAKAESKRLDANALAEQRRVDTNRKSDLDAVVLSTTRAELTASTLAEKVTDSANTLVTQVEQTKNAAALAVDATTDTLGGRIKPLEDARYEQAGRSGGRLDITKILWAAVGFMVPLILYILTQVGSPK